MQCQSCAKSTTEDTVCPDCDTCESCCGCRGAMDTSHDDDY